MKLIYPSSAKTSSMKIIFQSSDKKESSKKLQQTLLKSKIAEDKLFADNFTSNCDWDQKPELKCSRIFHLSF